MYRALTTSFRIVFLWLFCHTWTVRADTLPKQRDNHLSLPESSDWQIEELSRRQKFDYYYQEGLRLKARGDYAPAFEMFRHCLAIDSTEASVYAELGHFYAGLNKPERTQAYYRKAYLLDPDNHFYALQLAAVCQQNGRQDEAIDILKQTAEKSPENYALYYSLAKLYSDAGNHQAAIDALDRYENSAGKDREITLLKYRLYQQSGQPKSALRQIESLYKSQPNEIDHLLLLGSAQLDNGQLKKAQKSFLKAVEAEPDNGSARLSLANFYQEIKDTLNAEKQLQWALHHPKTDMESKLYILNYYLQSAKTHQDTLQIELYFKHLLEQHPDEYTIRELHMHWLLQRGLKKEAIIELRNVLDMNPNQLKAWQDYLGLNLEQAHFETIREICREAIVYFPQEAEFWYYLAITYLQEEHYDKALEAYAVCLQQIGDSNNQLASRILGYIGDIHQQHGENQTAYQYYESALQKDRNNALVLNNYAYFLCLEGGQYEKAEKMSRRSIDIEPNNSTYLDTYAWIYFRQGKYKLAKIYIERAFANQTDINSEITEHYGDILWFCEEKEAALLEWMKALDMQGDQASETLKKKVETQQYISEVPQDLPQTQP